ncbi:hypothetical protein L3Q82_014397 [Scortum barcoo]|uniref:Uncharacterized protein n=1 Tax=Scortum barcoo TaxID=214431 RepID=A0ACB8VWX3_9TELE|nr:hypothetical protein L3Q82_014397 [Scortum barcoo]
MNASLDVLKKCTVVENLLDMVLKRSTDLKLRVWSHSSHVNGLSKLQYCGADNEDSFSQGIEPSDCDVAHDPRHKEETEVVRKETPTEFSTVFTRSDCDRRTKETKSRHVRPPIIHMMCIHTGRFPETKSEKKRVYPRLCPGMMALVWVVLWSALPPLALLSGSDRCRVQESSSLQNESPLLESLQCHNDYKSYVHCKWRQHRNITTQLWLKENMKSEPKECVPYNVTVQDEHTTVQCQYKTATFSIGIKHTLFFLKNTTHTICSSVPHKPLHLSQHLSARPPVSLSTHSAGDGGRRLSWSSPYPPFSPLSRNITYQLAYRPDSQDNWTTEDVTNTSMKLEKQLLLPGHRYEARVRMRASVGHWSHWSPVVTWHVEEEAGQPPSLHCVLDGERQVMCSWKVSRELAHFITYQLVCRHKQTAPSESCCVNQTVSSDLSGAVLKYSCWLTDADPAHELLELLPTHSAKTFLASEHIRPNPPSQVKVRKKDRNWIVEWTRPKMSSKFNSLSKLFCYQVCYHNIQEQGCSTLLNISGSMSLNILDASLTPSQRYQVKVRSLIISGENSAYNGIPSEWSDPVDWTSSDATWSLTTLIYLSIAVFVASITLILYCTIPTCQRKIIVWVNSVPSPGKSKILSEIKSATSWAFMQSEDTSMCKVQHLDSISTCTSDTLLWPTKDTKKKLLEQDEGCWNCNDLPSPAKVNDTSSMSFSGPYIFCQPPEQTSKSADVKCEETEKETPSDPSASPSPMNFAPFGDGYVCLPSRSISRSTQDLVSQSDANANTHRHGNAEQGQQSPDTTLWPDKMDSKPGLSEPTSTPQPPDYTTGPFTSWPHGGTIQASGYCHLLTPHMTQK